MTQGPLRGDSQYYDYDFRYGETDLLEDALMHKARNYTMAVVFGLSTLLLLGLGMILLPMLSGEADAASERLNPTSNLGSADPLAQMQSPTVSPVMLALATVTEGQPTVPPTLTPSMTATLTLTPTPAPCEQIVGSGEGLYAVVSRCGHRDLYVITAVIDLNNLNSDTDIIAGQRLIVPWPTETPDPAGDAEPFGQPSDLTTSNTADQAPDLSGQMSAEDIAATQAVDPFFNPTPTNPPGVQNHQVQAGENIATIIVYYNTSIDVLEQLNPQITFSQCDFGTRFGGERCVVLLNTNQIIRVPAPTPTPTLSPTPSGSETPTPTATATFNAPSPLSPSNRSFFQRDQIVTLRWTTSAFLARGQAYLVQVENLTEGIVYTDQTTDLFYVLPRDWQSAASGRFEYEWTVSVIDVAASDTPLYATEPLAFSWEGQADPEENE